MIDFFIDLCFYSTLDGLILYLFCKNLLKDFYLNTKDIIITGFIFGICSALCSAVIPIMGISQICMGIGIGLILWKYKNNEFWKSVLYGIISITTMVVFEFGYTTICYFISNVSHLSYDLNSTIRILSYLFAKIIELIFFIVWRVILMKTKKVWLGGTKPR